jgi:hypothetical protein
VSAADYASVIGITKTREVAGIARIPATKFFLPDG